MLKIPIKFNNIYAFKISLFSRYTDFVAVFVIILLLFFSAIVRAQRDVQRISFRLGHSSGKRHLEFSLVEKGMNANNVHLKPCCNH